MKAVSVYDVIKELKEPERVKLFKMLGKPMPKVESFPYLNGWKGLSEYLGGTPIRNLHEWEKEGLIQKYKIGKKVFFKKKEIDSSLI